MDPINKNSGAVKKSCNQISKSTKQYATTHPTIRAGFNTQMVDPNVLQTQHDTTAMKSIESSELELRKSQNEDYTFQHSQSTVNESSLMITPVSSTLRNATTNDLESLRQSISQLKGLLQTETDTEDIINDFKRTILVSKDSSTFQNRTFQSAEKVQSQLLADEISWRNKYDLPVKEIKNLLDEKRDISDMSIGEFFRQKSNSLSDFCSTNPVIRTEPFPLIDNPTNLSTDFTINTSDIRVLLSDTAKTPKRILNVLMKPQNFKPRERTTSSSSCATEDPCIEKISSDTNGSLMCLPGGKLPLDTTKKELVWGCVKIDKSSTKDFLIKNKTSKTFRVQCSVANPDFRIKNDYRLDSDSLTTCKFILHGHEAKLLIISYKSSAVGPSLDRLEFTPLDPYLVQTKKQIVKIWAYGGHTGIKYRGVTRDNTGKYWLSLGRIDEKSYMTALEYTFIIENAGNLKACMFMKLLPKYFVTIQHIKIEPSSFLLHPNEKKNVSITYYLSAKDTRQLKNNFKNLPVLDIGKLEIVSCPEITRGRLNRLSKLAKEKGLYVNPLCDVLLQSVPDEEPSYELNFFTEDSVSMPELIQTIDNDEMIITIEQDPNQTLDLEPEDSFVYQSLLQDSTIVASDQPKCRIEPSAIILVPNEKAYDSFYLSSDSLRELNFIVHVYAAVPPTGEAPTKLNNDGLKITPSAGIIYPNQTTILRVNLVKPIDTVYNVVVRVETESYDLEVKVLTVKSPSYEI